MIEMGLASVTFRHKTPQETLEICKEAGLSCIEWGGDVHVPTGNLAAAKAVGVACKAQGVTVRSYGSYYRCEQQSEAQALVQTALALGAGNLRVWAGTQNSADASETYRNCVIACLTHLCALAAPHGLHVSLEFHNDTLADTADSVCALIQAVHQNNLHSYWQQDLRLDCAGNCANLQKLLTQGVLSDIHVFSFQDETRVSLHECAAQWQRFCAILTQQGHDCAAYFEFVTDDSAQSLYADSAALRTILQHK